MDRLIQHGPHAIRDPGQPVTISTLNEAPLIHQWNAIRRTTALSTTPAGDWRSYPHMRSKSTWRDLMRPPTQYLEDSLALYQVSLLPH